MKTWSGNCKLRPSSKAETMQTCQISLKVNFVAPQQPSSFRSHFLCQSSTNTQCIDTIPSSIPMSSLWPTEPQGSLLHLPSQCATSWHPSCFSHSAWKFIELLCFSLSGSILVHSHSLQSLDHHKTHLLWCLISCQTFATCNAMQQSNPLPLSVPQTHHQTMLIQPHILLF